MREKNEKYRYEIPKERQKKSFFSYSFFFVCLENQSGKQNGILQDDFCSAFI